MNCPSRTDDVLLHPDWNQSPPFFAADLTTCQDLNGIANDRELGDARGLSDGCCNLGHHQLDDSAEQERGKMRQQAGEGAKGPPRGLCTRSSDSCCQTKGCGSQHALPTPSCGPATTTTTATNYIDWAKWLLSVLATSVVICSVNNPQLFSRLFHWPSPHTSQGQESSAVPNKAMPHEKRDTCGKGGVENYNLPFHVGALFIILFVSASACAFPILIVRFPRLRIPSSFLFATKHFGTGVLIATAFVHLLPTAFLSLSDPCLDSFWTTDYPAMPGAIALAAIFFVTVIEMVFSPQQHACGGAGEQFNAITRTGDSQHQHQHGQPKIHVTSEPRPREVETGLPPRLERTISAPESPIEARRLGPLHGRATSISRTLSYMGEENERLDEVEFGPTEAQLAARKNEADYAVDDTEQNVQPHSHVLTPEQERQKSVMQVVLLEMGILFHSVFIGMSLSVSVGSEFVILLIAIIFHQTFEGLALGVRIASIDWGKGALQPWLMALAYGCTTPLGQAIGIATHTLYSPDSEVGLLVVGIMNAISAGLLVFASLVELMSEEFLSDESWRILRGRKRVFACLLVFFGAFFMSLVGAWA